MNKTIAKVGYAMLTETTAGTITYDKVKWFKSDKAGGRTVGAEPSGESTTVYADGLPAVSYTHLSRSATRKRRIKFSSI